MANFSQLTPENVPPSVGETSWQNLVEKCEQPRPSYEGPVAPQHQVGQFPKTLFDTFENSYPLSIQLL